LGSSVVGRRTLSDGPSAAPNLGLVASTDGAFSWESVSLREEVDFHDLEAAELPDGQLQIYGYDAGAGTVRASNDTGVTWTTGAKLDLRDLAVDPATSDRVFATTANGLVVSNDARSSFMPVPDAPALYLLTITPDNGEFIGIDTEGTVWTSPMRRFGPTVLGSQAKPKHSPTSVGEHHRYSSPMSAASSQPMTTAPRSPCWSSTATLPDDPPMMHLSAITGTELWSDRRNARRISTARRRSLGLANVGLEGLPESWTESPHERTHSR
jgi:hypothetical protein